MSETEKNKIKRLSDNFEKLSEKNQIYLAGIAEGMKLANNGECQEEVAEESE